MAIIGGFDVHRAQITFDYIDTQTGEVRTGQIRPANRAVLAKWLDRFDGCEEVAFVVEGCTGWRFVVEEMSAAGVEPHLAEPADTAVTVNPFTANAVRSAQERESAVPRLSAGRAKVNASPMEKTLNQ